MCTLALYFRTFDDYPLLVAANRDEHFDRPSTPPALQNTRPKIIAGKDLRAGGTWLGVNEYGLMVGILNRRTDGPVQHPTLVRSRGLLCLNLLHKQSAAAAKQFIAAHDERYNPFTVVYADQESAFVAHNDGAKIISHALDPGLHVFSSAATVDLQSAKADRIYERFAGLTHDSRARANAPRRWLPALQSILADHRLRDGSDNPSDAICVHGESSGTVSSSVIFLAHARGQFETFYCPGAPCQNSYADSLALPLRC